MELTLTFTGKRPAKIYGYDEKRRTHYSRTVETLERHIKQIFLPIGYTRFITGGTAGCLTYASKQNHIKMYILDKNTLELI